MLYGTFSRVFDEENEHIILAEQRIQGDNIRTANQGVPGLLLNPKIMSQTNPLHIITQYLFTIHFNITLPLVLRSPKLTKNFVCITLGKILGFKEDEITN